MSLKNKISISLFFLFFSCVCTAQGQENTLNSQQAVRGDSAIFRFVPKEEMFWATYKGNTSAIEFFTRQIQRYLSSIQAGEMKVRVLGFCNSYDSFEENLAAAKNRSNQVKSYFIVHEGLKEEHFKTTNSTQPYQNMADVIAVAYLFRTSGKPLQQPQDTLLQEEKTIPAVQEKTQPDTHTLPHTEHPNISRQETSPIKALPAADQDEPTSSYRWAIKTNLAYAAATVANLGIEFGFGEHYSIDLPVIYSPYTVSRDYRLRLLVFQPEFRYWMDRHMKGHFFGAHLHAGAFNISVDGKNRYQSPDGFYGAGISYGYMLPFARHWAAEFTIGAGYVHTQYDTYYNIPNGTRYEKGISYNYWGLTKAGIGLVYTFGK